jgi:HD-like signal output (HDOD) protein
VQQPSASDPATTAILKAAAALGVLGQNGSTAPRILATLYDPEATPAKIAGVIALEPGLTVRVLRVANSSLYGLRQKVATLDRAVLVLGLDAVRSVAAAACFDRGLLQGARKLPIDVDALQLHSLATAVAAEGLANLHNKSKSAEAFIAGLLHDLGVMIQQRLDGGDMQALLEQIRGSDDASARRPAGAVIEHERCSSVTLEAWGLPPGLVAATRHHHTPHAAPEPHSRVAALVAIADYLSTAAGMGFACGGTPPALDAELCALAGLTSEEADTVAAALPARVAAIQTALAEP